MGGQQALRPSRSRDRLAPITAGPCQRDGRSRLSMTILRSAPRKASILLGAEASKRAWNPARSCNCSMPIMYFSTPVLGGQAAIGVTALDGNVSTTVFATLAGAGGG
jgi:hypothetical protein